jgi:hypothetical protein
MARVLRTLAAWCCLCLATPAFAVPSIFPEDAIFASLGYDGSLVGTIGFEVVLPVNYLDVSVGLEAYAPLGSVSDIGVRLSGTGLVFPAFGTTPPLALGLGADAGYGPGGFSLHAGPLVGTDLLFSLRLPMTTSLYLGPGYASESGFSLAWAAQIRYYFDGDAVALELNSTDLAPLGLSVRVLF